MKSLRILSLVFIVTLLSALMLVVGAAQAPKGPEVPGVEASAPEQHTVSARSPDSLEPTVRPSFKNDLSPPLRSILPRLPAKGVRSKSPRLPLPRQAGEARGSRPEGDADPIVQDWHGTLPMPAPIRSFDGIESLDNQTYAGFLRMPPDTQGDVGLNHYVQWLNVVFAIWDKSGNLLYGPAGGNTLWTGFGGACEDSNEGDPITLYDPFADRWLMGQFAWHHWPDGPFYQCIAVSATGDPTGAWHRYAYEWQNGLGQSVLNDYPKFGVWPDGYYMTTNQFIGGALTWAGAGVAAFDREQMLRGQPAEMVYFDLGLSNWGGMLPADFDGSLPPPSGAPGYFVEATADEWDAGLDDMLILYEFDVDWSTPLNSTFARVATLPMAPFDGDMCGLSLDCIPQPDTVQKLDALADRLMYRLQYRNFGLHETLVSNLTVDADGSDHAGVRWFELRKTKDTWAFHQQGTYAPDSDHRWMGSIAMDRAGNIALGYSVSSSSTYPSIRYAGRQAADPIGTLPRSEAELVAGSSYQAGGNRWGDYSMMTLDPADDCTFWYTQEYVSDPGAWGNWNTRIGSFRFADCLGPTGTLEGTVADMGTGEPIVGARVTAKANPTYVTTSQSPDGNYRFEALPSGTYTLTAMAYAYEAQTLPGVAVSAGETTITDFQLAPAPTHTLSGNVSDATTGWPLYASITIEGEDHPGDTVWTDPATGDFSATLAADVTYTLRVEAWVDGYYPIERNLDPLDGDRIENFELEANIEICTAPGYELAITGAYEPFEEDGALPIDWTIVDNEGNGQTWQFDDPGSRTNLTGGSGGFAIVDSDFYAWTGQQDTELWSPHLDLSSIVTVSLEFDTDYFTYSGNATNDIADVDISTDDGETWTNVWRRTGTSYRGPIHETVDISPLAGGQPDVIVRFHYYDAEWEWWWQVDNVLVGQDMGCQPRPGGLVYGNVHDANTSEALTGAEVSNDSGDSTTALATPADPVQNDAFYVLFSPEGAHTLTASMVGGYGSDAKTVTMQNGKVLRQDFDLPMGWLAYEPDEMDVTLEMGQSASRPLRLSNLGGQSLQFEIVEMETGFDAIGSSEPIEITIPGTTITHGLDARVAKKHTVFRPELTFVVEPRVRPAGSLQVLLLTPDDGAGGDISLIQTVLAAFPDLDFAVWDATLGTPSGEDLLPYDVVIVGNDYPWTSAGLSPVEVGNALADYIDVGGKVIDTLFVPDHAGWQLGGRYTGEGYTTFTPSTADMTAIPYSLGKVYDPGHPVMDGVTTVHDSPAIGTGHQNVGVAAGATRLADWDDGQVYIAYNEHVVGFNQLWYHGANWTGNVPKLMHNAILYLSSGEVDWLSATPVSGTIGSSDQQTVTVTFDTLVPSVTQAGSYHGKLYLNNNTAYGNPEIPVTMTVSATPVCTQVTGVELTLVNTDTIYTGIPVEFRADIFPDGVAPPYNYALDHGDGSGSETGTGSLDPLFLQYTYSEPGTYEAEIAVWNCDLTQEDAVVDGASVRVRATEDTIYLPIIYRNYLPRASR